MHKIPTIKDIAEIAGVSATAVSMALNDRPRISPETREKILAIAKKLNYRPNIIARSLVKKKSKTIGLIITTFLNPFYPELAKGIEDKTLELGYSIIFCSTQEKLDLEKYHIENLLSKGVDGIILSSVKTRDPNINALFRQQIPFVLANRRIHDPSLIEKIDCVIMDNRLGAYLAMDHLYKMGHRRIAVLAGPSNTSTATERTEGVNKFINDYGLKIPPNFFSVCHYSREMAYQATRGFLSQKVSPTAIFAENDYMALSCRDAIFDAGLRIPQDFALVGFDNISETALKGVEITTIGEKRYEMGSLAVQRLIEKIEKKPFPPPKQILLKPELIIRTSCGYHLNVRL